MARAGSAREERVNEAEVSGKVAPRKLLEIAHHKGAVLPAAVAGGAPAAPYRNLRLEQVHEKRADTRQRKQRGHAAPGWYVAAKALEAQIKVANSAKHETESRLNISLRWRNSLKC